MSIFFSNEGAFRRPITYDNHPIHPNQNIALKTTSHELRWTKMNWDDLRWTKMISDELRWTKWTKMD